MPYSHWYPWQWITRRADLQLTWHWQDHAYDVARLQRELDAILEHYAVVPHYRPYLANGWGAITLVGPHGDPNEHRSDQIVRGAVENLKTPVLEHAPYMESIIDSFPGGRGRVRLMHLRAGRQIYWHHDGARFGVDAELARLHIPIRTNSGVQFQVSHVDCHWPPGQLFFLDNSFPHRVWNRGSEGRIHMVLDLEVDDAVRAMFPQSFHDQLEMRRQCRKRCTEWHDRTIGQVFRLQKRIHQRRARRRALVTASG